MWSHPEGNAVSSLADLEMGTYYLPCIQMKPGFKPSPIFLGSGT